MITRILDHSVVRYDQFKPTQGANNVVATPGKTPLRLPQSQLLHTPPTPPHPRPLHAVLRADNEKINWKSLVSLNSRTAYCVLRTAYCVLRAACCVLRTACCVLRAACCVLRTAYCVLRTVYCVLCTAYCVLCTVYCAGLLLENLFE